MTRGTTFAAVTGLLPVLLIGVLDGRPRAGASSEGRDTDVSAGQGGHLGVESTIGDLLRHPAFAGFAHLILPWDDRAYDEQMPLTRIGSLLPYHSHVDAETVASALNRMIDEAARGRTVFYRFYSEAERQQEPAREQHGAVLLPRTSRRAVRGRLPRRRVLLCRLRPRGLSACRGDQQQGVQRLRPEVPGRAWRSGRHPGPGGGGHLHPSQRRDARRQHQRLLPVGQLGRREDGRRDRLARRGELRRRRRSQAVSRRHGVHRALGSRLRRASHVRRGGRGGRDRPSRRHEEEGRGPAQGRHARWSSTSTRGWGMASGSAPARAPRDGSSKPSGSGRRR